MKDIHELEKAVNACCDRHELTPQYTERFPDKMIYTVRTMDYTQLEAKITKSKVVFKVDGKVTSLYS